MLDNALYYALSSVLRHTISYIRSKLHIFCYSDTHTNTCIHIFFAAYYNKVYNCTLCSYLSIILYHRSVSSNQKFVLILAPFNLNIFTLNFPVFIYCCSSITGLHKIIIISQLICIYFIILPRLHIIMPIVIYIYN